VFITAPGLVQHLHPSEVAPRKSHWPAVTLALERPWYLLVHRVACGGGGGDGGRTQSQTTLVGWDATLLDLLACLPAADITGLARLERRADVGPGWALQWITALWASAPGESAALGGLLFQLGPDPQLRDTQLRPVGPAPGRRLLYAVAPGPAPPRAGAGASRRGPG